MKLDPHQQAAVDLMQGGENVFVSGMAGTGKSAVTVAYLGQSFQAVAVCATTGIAALNLQQQFTERAGFPVAVHTIYRWSGIQLGPKPGQPFQQYYDYLIHTMTRSRLAAFRRIELAECVVIDEISMLPGRIFRFLDFLFRMQRGVNEPFGGCQIIAVGDFLQLPPVAKDGKYDWAFQTELWQAMGFQNIYLTRIHRQDEPAFINTLNDFREGRIRGETAEIMMKRIARFPDRKILRLFTHNVQVDKWNAYQLGEIDAPEHVFEATLTGNEFEQKYLRKCLVTPTRLVVKIGARVMVTTNLSQEGQLVAVNGQCGTVNSVRETWIGVELDGGKQLAIERYTWQADAQNDDSAKFTQYPLRPAYALTIHKSQGLTLDSALIDIRAAREPGQAYVAVSRLRRLEGLHLKSYFKGIFVSQDAINFYRNIANDPARNPTGPEPAKQSTNRPVLRAG
ncbi:MAG: DEAD/DEAH box helicase [Opitutaceae bacterium]